MKNQGIRGVFIITIVIFLLMITSCKQQQTPAQTTEQSIEDQETETPEQQETPAPEVKSGPAQIITVAETEWKITLDKKEVQAGKLKFIITNDGPRLPHAFRIVNKATGKGVGDQASVNIDEVDTLEVTLQPGTYEIYCPLSGHKEKGMTTTLVVK